ncbi:WD repeat and HMG-box DNA-binding protein 1 isoform X3 [Juglans regia]|uniref:WD repeat and HMG-box DNA-binding protein 1 isoform X3 n=1 Tax=Juglans regia TaxID=51240 RepID=A0A6P9EFI1_JUGRE|nr:WD repeat and HMG-box DNA-binding protein 1 isoform X3 [Juglans regia]
MKVRSVKLREAHKVTANNGRGSFCSVLWDQQALHLVTASSSDPSISIHDPLLPSTAPKILRHHRDGVTALAISPNSTCLASGSVDHSVKLYKFPGGEFETNITRFTLPIRALAFNRSGSMLAAAGDDEGIKLINTIDGSIARVLKGHKGPVTSLAFDPNSEYLASIDSTGSVIYWELHSGRTLHTLNGIAPDTGSDLSVMNVVSWSPDGETLAVPGLRNDLVMYDRDTAEKLFSLRGDHTQPICFFSWSPNGKYLATSGLDRQVLIWDVARKQDIDRHKFDDNICCMAWKPIGNALAIIDVMGKYGVWESVVPSSMKSPTDDVPNLQSKNSNGLLLFDEDEQDVNVSGSLSDLGEDSHGETEAPCRKRLRKQSAYEENFSEGGSEEWSLPPKVDSRKKMNCRNKESLNRNEGLRSIMTSARMKMQEAFQPGATPAQPGKRRFLCYNMAGSITTIEHDGYSHIEIDFHDTGKGPRVPSMTDHFGFTVAALNENASVFANSCKGEKNMSTLMYRPFSTWANNSEWSMRLEGEEVKVVALGTAWVAAITSSNFLRIFTEGGLQKHVLSLDGPVVTAAGFKDELAVVTHASDCLPSNDQIQKRMEEMAGAGLDTTSLDDEAFSMEVAQDRCILRLIASCCNGDKLVRATELVKLLTMEKSVKGAIKLVTALKLPNLAERFNSVLEERLLNEAKRTKQKPLQNSVAHVAVNKTLTSAEKINTTESPLSSPKLTAPLFTKKAKSQEVARVGIQKTEQNQIPVLDDIEKEKEIEDVKSYEEVKKFGEMSGIQPNRSSNPFVKSSNKEANKLVENQVQSHRPSNPFLKSSIK